MKESIPNIVRYSRRYVKPLLRQDGRRDQAHAVHKDGKVELLKALRLNRESSTGDMAYYDFPCLLCYCSGE